MTRHAIDNAARIARAENALLDYDHASEGEDAVTDLLTDLLHFAGHHGYRVKDLIARARGHFDAERKEASRQA